MKILASAMEDINTIVDKALHNYFNSLSKFGYKSYKDVFKLLILILIQELLESPYKYYITEEDYKIINKALYCLIGTTCLIPYPTLNMDDTLFIDSYITEFFRLMLDNSNKITEDNTLKVIN